MPHARRTGPTLGQSLMRYWWVVVLSALVFAAIGFLWSSQQDSRYTATTRLFLSHSSAFDGVGQSSFVANPDRYAVNQATIATSRPVLARAVADGDLDIEVEELGRSVVITAGRGNDVIIIDATASTPALAAQRANAVSEAYQALRLEEVERQTEQLTALSTTEAEQAAVLKRAAVYGNGIELIEQATPPDDPSFPQPRRDALLALLVGAAVGVGLAAILDAVRGVRARRESDETSTESPVREGTVPSADNSDMAGARHGDADPTAGLGRSSPADEPAMARTSDKYS